jgi:hypothetical protein
MCYLVREQQAQPEPRGSSTPPSLERLRPRVIGAVAAALVAGLALAALVPPSAPAGVKATEPAAPAPLVSRASVLPAASVVELTSTTLDDGVPSSKAEMAKAGLGHCEHGL